DLALDDKQIIQIAVVWLGPDVCVVARIDQLRVYTKMRSAPADAALKNMGYPQIISDLPKIPFATVLHHAGPADDFQVVYLRQLGQNVVLNAIGKGCVLFLLAQIFKRQNGDSSCYRMTA